MHLSAEIPEDQSCKRSRTQVGEELLKGGKLFYEPKRKHDA
jgi:hypothetical protein